ncbi:hypothetical protein H6P81_008886 [Aristolochia fimbriata]|uniref:Uncharacterized protein n=1 Tax=Aristolochia fimbriata TaxID=158543 RepID=A0AAV7EMK7_ARIFI|nr:hypothetical protein H6P81_008886 [Aristolochia fimbriata]
MTMMSKTRNMLEGLVREGSFKWVLSSRTPFDEEFEEMSRSPSGQRKWISELSPIANVVVGRCSRILDVSMHELQHNFDLESSDFMKHSSRYARNLLEYCCFRALYASTRVVGHISDKHFRRLTFDMMLAWEAPAASREPVPKIDAESTVGSEAFSRVAPAVPTIADVTTCDDLFVALTASTGGRLSFSVYDKYLGGLERSIKKMKTQSESSLLSGLRLPRGERILEVDGTVTTQPVLQHVGTSTWPGRLVLTDHALYFEPLKVVTFDIAKVYDLSEDLRQTVKPELTGPWGTRLFDKAVLYKSVKIPEPVVMEFPELIGNSRRDYWLAIVREILYAHRFIRKYHMKGLQQEEALSKAILGILRVQALQDTIATEQLHYESLLMFNLADRLPGGDLVLEAFASLLASHEMEQGNTVSVQSGMYSMSAMAMLSNLGAVFGSSTQAVEERRVLVGDIVVGEVTSLEAAVKESRSNFKKVELAQATVNGVKVEGIDTNLAVMKELLLPVIEIGQFVSLLASWDEPIKSVAFCAIGAYVICRGWLCFTFGLVVLWVAIFMLLTRCLSQGRPVDEVKVLAPPPLNTMEQLLAVQNAISQVEELVQDGNVVLLKLRALLLAALPQATEKVALSLALMALLVVFLPSKYLILLVFLEIFTRYSPPRKSSTERWMRRLREWWFSIPAAPVLLEGSKEDKKKR